LGGRERVKKKRAPHKKQGRENRMHILNTNPGKRKRDKRKPQ